MDPNAQSVWIDIGTVKPRPSRSTDLGIKPTCRPSLGPSITSGVAPRQRCTPLIQFEPTAAMLPSFWNTMGHRTLASDAGDKP